MRILVTGSRDWTDYETIVDAISEAAMDRDDDERVVVVHGGARGADTLADQAAKLLGFGVEAHPVRPADWDRYGKSAGFRRNTAMVAAGADVCLAFFLGASDGTRMCARLARLANIPVRPYHANPGLF